MAQLYKNDKGFLIIQMTHLEATLDCEFGLRTSRFTSKILCDTCNNEIDGIDDIFYVAIINRCLCKECCDDFIKGYNRIPDDIPYEKRHYNRYAELLNLEKV